MTDQSENDPLPTLAILEATPQPTDHEFAINASENMYECVRIEISIRAEQDKLLLVLEGAFATDKIPYESTNLFGSKVHSHYIEFGLRSGTLRIQLRNATAPLGKRYNPQFAETYTSKRTFSEESGRSTGTKFGFSGWRLTGGLDAGWRYSSEVGGGSESSQATFTAFGSDAEPCWTCDSGDPARLLAGSPPGRDPALSELRSEGGRIRATAAYVVRPTDLLVRRILPVNFAATKPTKKLAVLALALPELVARRCTGAVNGELTIARSSTYHDIASPHIASGGS